MTTTTTTATVSSSSSINSVALCPDTTITTTATVSCSSVNSVALCPDSQQFVVGWNSGCVRVGDTSVSNKTETKQFPQSHGDSVNSVAFSLDGKFVISGSSDKKIFYWTSMGQWKAAFNADSIVNSVAFSPKSNCKFLSGDNNGKVKLWSTEEHTKPKEFPNRDQFAQVNSVVFLPDNDTHFLSGHYNGEVNLWNGVSEKLASTFKLDEVASVSSIAFLANDNNQFLVGYTNGNVYLWNTRQQDKPVGGPWSSKNSVSSIAPTTSNDQFLVGYANGKICLWNINDLLNPKGNWEHHYAVNSIATSSRDNTGFLIGSSIGIKFIKYSSIKENIRKENIIRKGVVFQGSLNWDYVTGVHKKIEELKEKGFLKTGKMNFIVGITGAGKSTLLNYIAGAALCVKNEMLEVSKTTQINFQAKIGHEAVSETDIPNGFITNNICYLDCPGEFDNKDEKQNLINSSLKEYCGKSVKEVKITLVVEQQALETGRGAGLRRILDNLGNFVGDWKTISENRSVSMVITKAERFPGVRENVIKKLERIMISEENADIKYLLKDIIDRKAIAIFCKPQNDQEERKRKLGRLQQAKVLYGYGMNKDKIANVIEGFNLSAEEVNREIQRIGTSSAENQEVSYRPFQDGEMCFDRKQILQILDEGEFKRVEDDFFKKNLSAEVQLRIHTICLDLVNLMRDELNTIVVPAAMQLLFNNHNDSYVEYLCRSIEECENISALVKVCDGKESEDLKQLQNHFKFFSGFEINRSKDFGCKTILKITERLCSDLRAVSTKLKSIKDQQEDHEQVVQKTNKVAKAKSSTSKEKFVLAVASVVGTVGTVAICVATGGLPVVFAAAGTAAGDVLYVGGIVGVTASISGSGGFISSMISMNRALNEAETLRNLSKKRLEHIVKEQGKIGEQEAKYNEEVKKVNERGLMYAVKIDPGVVQEAWNSCAKGELTFSKAKGEVYFEVNENKFKGKFNIDTHCFGRGKNNCISGTMLHMASFYGQENMVRTLLNAGANILVDIEGKTPCLLAAEKGNEIVLEIFKSHSLDNFDRELLLAAEKGSGKAITLLLNAGADEKTQDEQKKWNALLWAVYEAGEEAVKACLESGKFNVNEVCENSKQNALHIAALYNKTNSIVEMLLDGGAEVQMKDSDGYTAFLLAIKYNPWRSGGIPEKILNKMLETDDGFNFCTETLFLSVEKNVEGVVTLLAAKHKPCVFQRKWLDPKGFNKTTSEDEAEYTPLTRACQLGHEKIVKELLNAAADQKATVLIKGSSCVGRDASWTARDIAKQQCLMEIVDLLECSKTKNSINHGK